MNSFIDNSVVGLALLISAGYAAASLGPRSLRKRGLAAVSRIVARAPAFLNPSGWAARLDAAARGKTAGACGGCDNCGSEKTPAPSGPSEVRIAVTKIGRRA